MATPTFWPTMPPELILFDPGLLNGTAKNLYCWMLMRAEGSAMCEARQATMAAELGHNTRTIRNSLRALERAGFVKTDECGRQNLYHLMRT